MKKYKQIEFSIGNSIDSAVKEMSQYNELVCGSFNGHTLYSDIDTLDSAYKKITGKTKSEFDAERKAEHDRYNEQKQKHKDSIPELTIEWIEKGNSILDKKYRELWAECVPIRLGDLYEGMELKCCLDIVVELNKGCTLDVAKSIIDEQGHSGMSFGLVCSMVKSFCDRGEAFVDYARS